MERIFCDVAFHVCRSNGAHEQGMGGQWGQTERHFRPLRTLDSAPMRLIWLCCAQNQQAEI